MLISEHPLTLWGCVGVREQRCEGLWDLLVSTLLVATCIKGAPVVGETSS